MCLSNRKKYERTDMNNTHIGYKLYNSYTGSGFHYMYGDYKPGVLHKASNLAYPFHIIKKSELKKALQTAKNWSCYLVEVEYSEVKETGTQYSLDCVTAMNMRITKQLTTPLGELLKTPKIFANTVKSTLGKFKIRKRIAA